jgi:AcrR family transcriptional regulator
MNRHHHDHSTVTRERLLATAERLFAERGYAATSVRQITDAAGANLGAVNYHFRSKENLYKEVFARRVSLLRDPLLAVTRNTADLARGDLDEALRIFGRAFVAPLKDRGSSQRLRNLFTRETIEGYLPPGLLLKEYLLPIIRALTGIMRRARPDLTLTTVQACAHSFLAQLLHIVKGAGVVMTPTDEQLEHVVRFTVAAVRHVKAEGRKPSRRETHGTQY